MKSIAIILLLAPLTASAAGEFVPTRPQPIKRMIRYDYLRARAAIANRVGRLIGEAELVHIGGWRWKYGVKDYHEVVKPGLLWRGSRVDAPAIAKLKQDGIRAIIALTKETAEDRKPTLAQHMSYLRLPILDNTAPTSYAPIKQLMSFLSKSENQPAYIHCEAGQGRTGVMVAAVEMAMEGKNAGQAIVEARKHGLSLRSQVLFLRQLGRDLDAIRDRQARGELGDGPAWQYL